MVTHGYCALMQANGIINEPKEILTKRTITKYVFKTLAFLISHIWKLKEVCELSTPCVCAYEFKVKQMAVTKVHTES